MSKYRIPRVDAHGGSSSEDEDEDEDEDEEEESSSKEIGEQEAFGSSEKQEEYSTEEEVDKDKDEDEDEDEESSSKEIGEQEASGSSEKQEVYSTEEEVDKDKDEDEESSSKEIGEQEASESSEKQEECSTEVDEDEESSLKEIGEQEASESSEKQEECSTEEEDDSTTKEGGGGGGGGTGLQSGLKTSQISMTTSATSPLKRKPSGENRMLELKRKRKRKRVKGGIAEEEGGNVEEEKEEGNSGESKRVLFQRLWSEDDEIGLLNGMIEYKKKKGFVDLNGFFDFIKKSLHVNVNKGQLSDKIRRLKKKYQNNARKDEAGKFPIFWKAHEKKSYELSKKLWGEELATSLNRVVKEEKKSDAVGGSPPRESILDEKHKKLVVRELELFLEQVNLKRERTKLALEVMKSAGWMQE